MGRARRRSGRGTRRRSRRPRTVASQTPVWPTMSGLAKLATSRSKLPDSIPATSASVTPAALISGCRSYVATFGLGTRIRSSPVERRLAAAVQEVRDVGVLLRLGDVELAPARLCHRAGEAGHDLGRERDARPAGPPRTRPSSRRGGRRRRRAVGRGAIERCEVAVRERVVELAGAVGAEVRVDDRFAVGQSAVDAVDDGRPDELVGLVRWRTPPRSPRSRSRRARPRRARSRRSRASVRSQRLSRSIAK